MESLPENTPTIEDCRDRYDAAGNSQPDHDRSGPSWEEFCAKYRIKAIRDDAKKADLYHVESASGKTYEVTIREKRWDGYGLGPAMYLRCTCPARGGDCRHRTAVINCLMAEAVADENYDRADWLERIDC